jgi:hypothetical protein
MHLFPILHVLNGDSMSESLERSGISGRVTVWADALYEGPVPYDADDPKFNEVHARLWAVDTYSSDKPTR